MDTHKSAKIERVMTDNGSSFGSRLYAKAERFVQTGLREWAYARAYSASDDRAPRCPSGFTATTGIDLLAPSDQSRPSDESAQPTTTS
jgi:hypothetical protein